VSTTLVTKERTDVRTNGHVENIMSHASIDWRRHERPVKAVQELPEVCSSIKVAFYCLTLMNNTLTVYNGERRNKYLNGGHRNVT